MILIVAQRLLSLVGRLQSSTLLLPRMDPFVKAVSYTHLLKGDINSSLVYIENGTITNRHVGDGPSHVVLDVLSHDDGSEGRFGYLTKTKDGRILKSSTMYIQMCIRDSLHLLQ